jgi:hypothetical protein
MKDLHCLADPIEIPVAADIRLLKDHYIGIAYFRAGETVSGNVPSARSFSTESQADGAAGEKRARAKPALAKLEDSGATQVSRTYGEPGC